MRQIIIFGAFAVFALAAVSASPVSAAPGQELQPGGPLVGFAPPSQGGLSCTRYLNKRATIMPLNCEMSCAISFASAASKGIGFDYEYCRNTWQYSCVKQYERALDKLHHEHPGIHATLQVEPVEVETWHGHEVCSGRE